MPKHLNYRSDIDGLRAIAIFCVVIFHLNANLLPSGFVGVDIFFVISGFLITKIIIREINNNHFSFTHFYIRRIKRIFPALFLVLFVTLIFAILTLGTDDLLWFSKTLRYSAIQGSNILFQKEVGYFDPTFENTPLLHTWSLSVEEQFYVIYPILLYFLFKFKKNQNLAFYFLIATSILSLAISQYLLNIGHVKISFFSLPSRFWELGLGGILSFHKIKQPNSKVINESIGILGIILIATSLFNISQENFPGIAALLPCMGAALIIFSGHEERTITTMILSNRVFVFFGLISYSLYLWHYPIIALYKEFMAINQLDTMTCASILTISILTSFLSYKYIETPFRKGKNLKKEKYLNIGKFKIYYAFIASLIFIILMISIALIIKEQQRDKHKKIFGDTKNAIRSIEFHSDCLLDKNTNFSNDLTQKCTKGAKNINVLLIGDSHALRYSWGLIKWAKRKNYSITMIASTHCPPFINNKTSLCKKMQNHIDNIIKKHNKSLKYIIMANRWEQDTSNKNSRDILKKELENDIQNFTKQNIKPILIGLAPIFNFNPVHCISKNNSLLNKHFQHLNKKDCYKENKNDVMPQNTFLTKLFTQMRLKYGAEYFNPKQYLCDQKYCYSTMNKQILYTDDNHLSLYGSNHIAQYFDF